MKFLALSALALVAIVNAQSSIPTPDTCILTCAAQACPSEFTSANTTDYTCFCTTGTAAIISCLTANCTAADLATAQTLAGIVCAPPSNSTGPSTNGTSTTSSPGTTVTASTTKGAGTSTAGSTGTSTAKASTAASSSASNSNVVIGNGGLVGVLALAVAIAVSVGVVA